ncbi:MAG: TetR/AcrR family transcriptional regulator [Panacagrimonas sp.]
MKKPRITNRERIIEAAIWLMSERGSGVGTTQIAEHLNISPGNLYYHFRNREQIVREVLSRLRTDLAQTLALPGDGIVAYQQLVDYYANGAMVLWRYRFVVASALELIHRDPEIATSYHEFTVEGIEAVRKIIRKVVQQHPGPIPASPKDCANLAENMWVLWSGWPRHAELYRNNERVSQAAIAHGLEQIAMTLGPYSDPAYHQKVRRGLHRFVLSLDQGL